MLRKHIISLLIICGLIISGTAAGQGCSDAGGCTVAGFNPVSSGTLWSTHIGVYNVTGLGEQNTLVNTVTAALRINISQGIEFQVELPYSFASGNLGSTNGLGDMIVGLYNTLVDNNKIILNANLSGKLPSGDADKEIDGNPLPMVYQQSLGTYDIIAGLVLFVKTWQIAAGYQHPFYRNKNAFTHDAWPDNEDAWEYFESSGLDRGDDVMLRVQKNFPRPKAIYSMALLPIYRIQQSVISLEGEDVAVEGSDGLTINITGSASFKLGKSVDLNLVAGVPVLVRDIRPDGLTRTFVLTAGLNFTFGDVYELK